MPYETDVNFVVTCAFGLWADFNWPLRIQDGRCGDGAGYSGVVVVGLRNPNRANESRMADAMVALGILASLCEKQSDPKEPVVARINPDSYVSCRPEFVGVNR